MRYKLVSRKKANDMTAYAIERASLKEFIKNNKEKICQDAKNNTKYNDKGQAVISRDDSYFYEDEWDEHFKRINNK